MVFCVTGVSGAAIALGSYVGTWYIGIGSGSAAISSSRSGLIAETNRATMTGSPDYTVLYQFGVVADFSSTTLSGNTLKEFGLFSASSGNKTFEVEGFATQTFSGSEECQITITIASF